MIGRVRKARTAGGATVLLTLLAATPASPASPCEEVSGSDRARAQLLELQATELLRDPAAWARAAFRLERSARLRDPCDPEAFAAFRLAARVYHHVGKLEAARLCFLAAAERARRTGHLALATQSLLDAAETAVQQGHQAAAVQAVLEAERLRRSPRLDEEERLRLSRRILDLRSQRLAGGSR